MPAKRSLRQRLTPDRPVTDRSATITGPLTGLSFVSGLAAGLTISNAPFPQPGSDPAAIRAYFVDNRTGARITILGQLVSAASLARFTRTADKLAAHAGRAALPLRVVALLGGTVASASLLTGALHAAALTRARQDPARETTLHRRMFLAGGPAHGAGFGLLLTALGLAGQRTAQLPRGLNTAAVVAAIPNLLAPTLLLNDKAVWLIPAGRFPGLLTLAAAGLRIGAVE
jgi:hypothetical protein